MNTFYLIRHGQKVKEIGDPGLTDLGKIQASKTAIFLKGKEISKIISSTFKRTRESAEIIDGVLKIGIEFEDRLRERMNWGDDPNQPFEDFLKEWYETSEKRNQIPKVGLSSMETGKRVEQLINEISTDFPNKSVILVTHGGVICDLLRNIFSNDELRKTEPSFPEELDRLVKECSITTINYEKGKVLLSGFANTDHLKI